jgi:hypothetical protein
MYSVYTKHRCSRQSWFNCNSDGCTVGPTVQPSNRSCYILYILSSPAACQISRAEWIRSNHHRQHSHSQHCRFIMYLPTQLIPKNTRSPLALCTAVTDLSKAFATALVTSTSVTPLKINSTIAPQHQCHLDISNEKILLCWPIGPAAGRCSSTYILTRWLLPLLRVVGMLF